MKYLSFEIYNYRAVKSAKVEVSNNLIPIIGINESGKTTILQAILSFDKNKDRYNKGFHLKYRNKYIINRSQTKEFKIIANILIETDEDLEFLSEKLCITVADELYKKLKDFYTSQTPIKLARIFNPGKRNYQVQNDELRIGNKTNQQKLANALYERLPLILYFDDFSDRVPEEISFNIEQHDKGKLSINIKEDWELIIEEIFKRAGDSLTLQDFIEMEEKDDQDGLLNDIQDTLNAAIMNDWKKLKNRSSNFGEESEQLELTLNHEFSDDRKKVTFNFKVKDKTTKSSRMFNIVERSKGFQWFFNFTVKLKFNPKYQESQKGAIYLLDEPGSYLHTSAQKELLTKLKEISETNTILYCTHSQFLLDPEIINITKIKIAEKNSGQIQIHPFCSYGSSNDQGALTPLYQALHLDPYDTKAGMDYVVITEGITDYYLFKMIQSNLGLIKSEICFIPGSGASHLKELISYSIAFSKNYLVLLDLDSAGTKAYNKYQKFFGKEEIERHFFQYRLPSSNEETILLEDLLSDSNRELLLQMTECKDIKLALSLLFYSSPKELSDFFGSFDRNRIEVVLNKINSLVVV